MAAGLVRVVVLLCAAVAATRAWTWHSHGDPPGAWIQTALAPLLPYKGTRWFAPGTNGKLYERSQDSSGTWRWVDNGKPSSSSRYESDYNDVSDCSIVSKSGYKTRIFMRGSNGDLYEHLWEWNRRIGWTWRWHGRPLSPRPPNEPPVNVANIKPTSFLRSRNGMSYVFVVGTDGNMWLRVTQQNGGGRWYNLRRPAGKTIKSLHATRYGLWWAITTDGSVCRYHGGWPCFYLNDRPVLDCSDPYYAGGGRRSMFCITNNHDSYPRSSSFFWLYKLTVSGWGRSATASWVNYGKPTSGYANFFDRPNVAFDKFETWPVIQKPRSVFVPSTHGVFELRF
uniref:Uncharacterized protein n=1 Tax=Branchiostoma floridae TaxID=7739 RepID=C3ZDG9_BRAFL|eukprot:XP_002592764.1 hypothetical protein BRAFLDRAFT_65344 [Branchiostoma floridae]